VGDRPMVTRRKHTPMHLADLRKQAEWWWDEAAACERAGALGLREVAAAHAVTVVERLIERNG